MFINLNIQTGNSVTQESPGGIQAKKSESVFFCYFFFFCMTKQQAHVLLVNNGRISRHSEVQCSNLGGSDEVL